MRLDQDADAPQRAADALAALVPGPARTSTSSVPQDGQYVVTAQYTPDGSASSRTSGSACPTTASAVVDCTAFGTADATAVPPDATRHRRSIPDNTDRRCRPTRPVARRARPGEPAEHRRRRRHRTRPAPAGPHRRRAVARHRSPPTIDVRDGRRPDASPVSGATVYSCGYGWASSKRRRDRPRRQRLPTARSPASPSRSARSARTARRSRSRSTRSRAIAAADKIPDDVLQAVLDSPDVQPGGVCSAGLPAGRRRSPVRRSRTRPSPAHPDGRAVPPRSDGRTSGSSSYAPPPATASDLPLTGSPTTLAVGLGHRAAVRHQLSALTRRSCRGLSRAYSPRQGGRSSSREGQRARRRGRISSPYSVRNFSWSGPGAWKTRWLKPRSR